MLVCYFQFLSHSAVTNFWWEKGAYLLPNSLITRLVFYYYYNPSLSTYFRHIYPQFSIYVQFCHLRYLVSCILGFKYMRLGKISVSFAPLDLDFPEQASGGIYSFNIIIADF